MREKESKKAGLSFRVETHTREETRFTPTPPALLTLVHVPSTRLVLTPLKVTCLRTGRAKPRANPRV
ncbi:hypothetical protein CEXT_181501 [Caerostris extrusa]|uniref:Uncharacterized protein n=1 Tax=Caerostris extrusa TaxID=172846 RepID=A0AAV4RJG7_CAEEX|nr:hypothetical protein CEXT_181501 [Caerostris extrusa]